MSGLDTARRVPCPTCRGPSRYAADNPYRPFCSARCQGVDLGAWASGQFRIEAPAAPEDTGPPGGLASDRATGP